MAMGTVERLGTRLVKLTWSVESTTAETSWVERLEAAVHKPVLLLTVES